MSSKKVRGTILTITSTKGGVGKTFVTLLLASIYKSLKKKVLLVDLDLYAGSIAFILGVEPKNNIYNICDDMTNNRYKGINSNEYITTYDNYIDVLSAPKDPRQASKVDKKNLSILLSSLKNYYDVVLIDTNHILDMHSMVAFDASDKIVDIFTNDAIDLKGTKSFVSICNNVGVENLILVLNESSNKPEAFFSSFEIKTLLKHDIDYIVNDEFHLKNYDSYIINKTLMKVLGFSITKKNYKLLEQMAIELIDSPKEGDYNGEE